MTSVLAADTRREPNLFSSIISTCFFSPTVTSLFTYLISTYEFEQEKNPPDK